MLTSSSLRGAEVYEPKRGACREDGPWTEIGKIHYSIFSPEGDQLVGFMVKRPDIAGMVKQKDRFVALDSLELIDLGLCTDGEADCWDKAAWKRLGLDWDSCIAWEHMDVVTTSGEELGRVCDAGFDWEEGQVAWLGVADGAAGKGLVGLIKVPIELCLECRDQKLVVDPAACDISPDGGVAAAAGDAYAKAAEGARKGAKVAAQVADKAASKGAFKLGKLLGKAQRAIHGDDVKKQRSSQTTVKTASNENKVARVSKNKAQAPHKSTKKVKVVKKRAKAQQNMFVGFKNAFFSALDDK